MRCRVKYCMVCVVVSVALGDTLVFNNINLATIEDNSTVITTQLSRSSTSQSSPLSEEFVTLHVSSGTVRNTTSRKQTIFSYLVSIDNASSIQVQFGRTKLPQGTLLRMTSLQDGATQHHRATTLKQWNNKSAWFNGSHVLVELVAEPNAPTAHVTIDTATILHNNGDERTICGATDDRLPSFDPRCGRAIPIGCTAWLFDDPNHTFITAGHCADDGLGDIQTVEFNVPLSNSGGSIQHPPPSDQYAADPASFQATNGGIGNDWAYFGCFPNTETGMTPYQAQGDYYILSAAAPPVGGQTINITGYGTVSSPVTPTWNQIQKSHSGPYSELDSTSIAYQTDTSGGNSGSAVLNELTGEAIGIHTNGGCSSGGGQNWGCAIHNTGLQNALANPQGVCIPNFLYFDFPTDVPEEILPSTPTKLLFTVIAGVEEPIVESIEVRLTIDGNEESLVVTPLGGNLYTATIPALACDEVVSFYMRALGDGGTEVFNPFGAPNGQYEIAVGTLTETTIFEENFNGGIPTDWAASGFWNATTSCAPSGSCADGNAAYFGIVGQCTYDNGGTVSGTLATPPISLVGQFGDLTLTYCSSLITENLSGYDIAEVRANGVVVDTVTESSAWQERVVAISNISADSVVIEWVFNSVDGLFNDYRGWHVDGILITYSSADCVPAVPCPADIDGDGSVGVGDILLVIDQWGETVSPADINGDAIVDVSDLLLVVGSWGVCE